MDQTQIGFVDSLDGSYARVRFSPHSGCSECGACGGGSPTVLALNEAGAEPGDRVKLAQSTKDMFKVTLVVFVAPVAAVLLGIGLGQLLGYFFGIGAAVLSGVCASLLFISTLVYAVRFDRKAKAGASAVLRIVGILGAATGSEE